MKFDFSRVVRDAMTSSRAQGFPPTGRHVWDAMREKVARTETMPESLTGTGAPLGRIVEALRAAKLTPGRLAAVSGIKPRGAPEVVDGARFFSQSFTYPAGGRNCKIYLPANRATRGLPLIVMLHGCTQNPDDFALGTGMNALAEEIGFVIAYPQQPAVANPSSCWNWFDPKDQRRGGGEPSIIAGLTDEIAAAYEIDRARVYIAGLSAGGAMAATMGATYPDVYAGIGVHSGLAHGSASDVVSAFAAMRGDSNTLRRPSHVDAASQGPVRAIVFHGAADRTVDATNADKIVAQGYMGVRAIQTTTGTSGGRHCIRTIIRDEAGHVIAEKWIVQGGGHAWFGGNPAGSYADPAGPGASREMVRFFLGAD